MSTLNLKASQDSPKIFFDLKHGVIRFTGRACEQDFKAKFETLSRWVELYCRIPNRTTRIDIEFVDINDNWKNLMGHLLWYFVNLHENNRTQLSIFWFLPNEEERLVQTVEDIELNLKFKIHKLSPLLT